MTPFSQNVKKKVQLSLNFLKRRWHIYIRSCIFNGVEKPGLPTTTIRAENSISVDFENITSAIARPQHIANLNWINPSTFHHGTLWTFKPFSTGRGFCFPFVLTRKTPGLADKISFGLFFGLKFRETDNTHITST